MANAQKFKVARLILFHILYWPLYAVRIVLFTAYNLIDRAMDLVGELE